MRAGNKTWRAFVEPVLTPAEYPVAAEPTVAQITGKSCILSTGFFHVELFLARRERFQARFTNRVTGERFPLRFKPFQGVFDDERVSRSELTFMGAEAQSAPALSTVIAHYKGEWFDADVYYVVRQGEHVLHKHIVFRDIKRNIRLKRLSLFTHVFSENYETILHEAGMFCPVLFYRGRRGGLFFCADFPCYFAEIVDENFRFDYYPGVQLEPGRSFQSLSAVVGVYPVIKRGFRNRYHEKGAWLDLGERVWFRAYQEKNVSNRDLPYLELHGPSLKAPGPSERETIEESSWFGAEHLFLPSISTFPDSHPTTETLKQLIREKGLSTKFLWSRGDAENLKWLSMEMGDGADLPESRVYFSIDAFREQLIEQNLAAMEKHGFREVEVGGVPIVPHYSSRRRNADAFDIREMLHDAFQRFADICAALKETFGHVSATGAYRCYGAGLARLIDAVGCNPQPHPLALPDLHLGRLYADAERFAFRYVSDFLLPKSFFWNSVGFPHDPQDESVIPGAEYFPWYLYHDRLGWRYALISAIATGLRHRFYPVPVDFPDEEQMFAKRWLAWEKDNCAFLREVEPILDEPGLGTVDGYVSYTRNRCIVFLFNNSYEEQQVVLRLRLPQGGLYEVVEMYPNELRHLGDQEGAYEGGSNIKVALAARESKILDIHDAPPPHDAVTVYGAQAEIAGSKVRLRASPGTKKKVGVRCRGVFNVVNVSFDGETVDKYIENWFYTLSLYEQGRETLANGHFDGTRVTRNLGTLRNVWLRSHFRLPAYMADYFDLSPFRLCRPAWTYENRLFFVIRFEPSPVFDSIRTGSDVEEIPESFSPVQHMKTGIDVSSLNLGIRAWIDGRQCAVHPIVTPWHKLVPNPSPITGYFFEAGSKTRFGVKNNIVLFMRHFDSAAFRGIVMEHVPTVYSECVLDLPGTL